LTKRLWNACTKLIVCVICQNNLYTNFSSLQKYDTKRELMYVWYDYDNKGKEWYEMSSPPTLELPAYCSWLKIRIIPRRYMQKMLLLCSLLQYYPLTHIMHLLMPTCLLAFTLIFFPYTPSFNFLQDFLAIMVSQTVHSANLQFSTLR